MLIEHCIRYLHENNEAFLALCCIGRKVYYVEIEKLLYIIYAVWFIDSNMIQQKLLEIGSLRQFDSVCRIK